TMTVVVDAGYFNEAQLATCAQANITVYVPIPDYEQRLTAAGRLRAVGSAVRTSDLPCRRVAGVMIKAI
ncbi:hypothetical protein, partial [uncultured Lamprocystis sp.]